MSENDLKILAAAWQQLEESLVEANKVFLDRADGGREAAFRQLTAVNQFISTVAPDSSLLQIPLLSLNLAMHYLDHGVVEPILAPRSQESRRGRRPEQEVLKIRSAVAMSQLYEIGYGRKEAARRIAKELTNLGCQATPRAVADWRDHLKDHRASSESREIYRTMLAAENKNIDRDASSPPVEDEGARTRFARRIIKTFQSFVLLARLTANPKLGKLLQQSLKPKRN